MCFSATASFTLAAALVPVAGVALVAARRAGPGWWAFGLFPAAFAVQQAIEGAVWLGLAAGDTERVALAGRAFLFFSHCFWLAWPPFAAAMLATSRWRRRMLLGLSGFGLAFGLSIFLPAALNPGWLEVAVLDGSLDYRTRLVWDGILGREALRSLYVATVLGGLLLSGRAALVLFGVAIAVSLAVTEWLFPATYISVWCFFAAALSPLAALLIRRQPRWHI